MNIVFTHGAWAPKNSFNYISQFTRANNSYFFEYDCQKENLEIISNNLKTFILDNKIKDDIVFVGHSLGGVINLITSKRHFSKSTQGLITISSPVKGVFINPLLRPYMTMRAPILGEILPSSKYIREINRNEYPFPILSVISSSKFSPIVIGESDGVLPVGAQMWKPNCTQFTQLKFRNSHNEILLNQKFDKIFQRVYDYHVEFDKLKILNLNED